MRLKALSVALALGMLAPLAHAGLGEIRVLSAAGEPFLAEIPVLDEPGMLAPYASLASSQQYPFLDSYSASAFQLKILTVEEQPGRYVVRVMGPVMSANEALDFALELAWAAGREVRAFHAAPRADMLAAEPSVTTPVAAPVPLAFGEARLQSHPGEPLLAEVPLQGEWPDALTDGDFLFRRTAATPEGLVAVKYHQDGTRRWLTLQGLLPLQGEELVFVLETRARGMLVARSYRLPLRQSATGQTVVARQPGVSSKAGLYRVQTGDTLSSLVHGLARGLAQRNQLALQIVRDNPHAFVDGNPNRLLAGALLQLPQRQVARVPTHVAKPKALSGAAKPELTPLPRKAPPAPAVVVPPAAIKPAPASAPVSAPTLNAEEERQRIQRLHAAQQRINKLEQEIQRIADSQHAAASAPQPEPTAQHDADLMAALDDWVLTGIGGASVLSLLAWALWRRRRQQAAEPAQEQLRAQQAAAAEALKQRTSEAVQVAAVAPADAIEVTELPSMPAEEPVVTGANDDQMLMLELPDEVGASAEEVGLAASSDVLPETAQLSAEAPPVPEPEQLDTQPLETAPEVVAPAETFPVDADDTARSDMITEIDSMLSIADGESTDALPQADAEVAPGAPLLQVDEVLAEVDVHMLYGHRDEAIQVLRSALPRAPQAEPLRHRLLQLLAEAGDRAAFEAEALDALASGGADSTLWGKVLPLGASIDPANPLYGAQPAAPAVPVPEAALAQPAVVQPAIAPAAPLMPAPQPASDVPPPVSAPVQAPREPARQVRRVAANQPVAVAELAETDAETAALAQLYREMGDTEMADALLKGNGD